jgi:HD-GYP domain-containing protein (c-di-GMP phosphodiesterase class II)
MLEVRIISVAYVVEAIILHRSYRPASGVYKVLSEIKENKS